MITKNKTILPVLIVVCTHVSSQSLASERKQLADSTVQHTEQLGSDIPENKQDMGAITVEGENEQRNLTLSPMPVAVIDAERFHGRNISLNEVLKRVAGVKLAQEGGLGSRSTIAIHGLEGQRVKIFVDGNPLNSPDGSFGINDIPIQFIERIEIYKGVVPARFGGDALGGAVNVVIREHNRDYIDTTLLLGSYDTVRFASAVQKTWDDIGLELGLGGFYNHAANDYVMKSPFIKDHKIRRDHDEFESTVVSFYGALKDRWFDEISWEFVRYKSEKEMQGIQYNIREAKNKSTIDIVGVSFEKEHFLVDQLEFDYDFIHPEITLNYIDKATNCYNFDGSARTCPGVGGETSGIPHDSADEQNELRHDLNLRYSLHRNHALNFHWNSVYSKYTPKDPLSSQALGYDVGQFPSEKTNTISTLSYESSFFNQQLVSDVGVKLYEWNYDITAQERSLTGTPPQTHNNGDEFGYYLSTRYSPWKDLYLKASYEKAFRLPDSSEAFGDGITIISSPNIQPEEGENLNLGVLFDRFDAWGMPWLKAEVNYFNRDVTNMIKLVPGNLTLQYANLGEISVEGFEFEFKADITDQWYLFFNYTKQELVDQQKFLTGTQSTPNPSYGLDVPNVPQQLANIGLEYKTFGLFRNDSMLKLFWETNWVDDYYYGWELSEFQDRKIDAQRAHTAGFEYSFHNDEIILGFEVRNLTDEDITDVFNYPLMGRSYHASLRYTWLD